MELVALLRVLWRFWLVVAVGFIVAGALGYMAHQGPVTQVGLASTRVMLDTPQSQTLVADATFSDTLDWRASLLADLMSTDDVRQTISREMSIKPDELYVHAPYMSVPPIAAQLPRQALDAAAAVPEPYDLRIQAADYLPIIDIDARAPDSALAAKLVAGAVRAIKASASADASEVGRYVVTDVGTVHERTVVNGPRKMTIGVVAIVVLGMWCAAITVLAAVLDRRRASRSRTELAQLEASAGTAAAAG